MKHIEPVNAQRTPNYPTAEEAGVNRRGFFKIVVASGAAAVGGAVLGGDVAHARGAVARPRYRVAIDLKPPYTYKGCNSAIVQIVARCYSRDLYSFLNDKKQRPSVLSAVKGVLKQYKCTDITGAGRYKVQSALGKALGDLFKKRKGRYVGRPWCQLVTRPVKKKKVRRPFTALGLPRSRTGVGFPPIPPRSPDPAPRRMLSLWDSKVAGGSRGHGS